MEFLQLSGLDSSLPLAKKTSRSILRENERKCLNLEFLPMIHASIAADPEAEEMLKGATRYIGFDRLFQ